MPSEVAHLKCTKVSESQLIGANEDNKDHEMLRSELCEIFRYILFLRKVQS